MAATRYLVSATANSAERVMSNLKAAKKVADDRAFADRETVTVTTQATGRVSYTAEVIPVVIADQAEVEAALLAEERSEALAGVAAVLGALAAKTAQRIEDAPQGPVKAEADPAAEAAAAADFDAILAEVKAESRPAARPAARKAGLRDALGASAVDGWELLYDKPRQRAQVGRRFAGEKAQYALICTDHSHAHELTRLTQERGLRGGKRSVWCPSCA